LHIGVSIFIFYDIKMADDVVDKNNE